MGELDDMGMLDNTLLVLASDNGGCPAYGGSNYPFRGFKHSMFEGGVRTPAFVYSKSESIIPAEVSTLTMQYATSCNAGGAEMSGQNIASWFSSKRQLSFQSHVHSLETS